MIKKVNVKEANTLWLISMFIPIVNGFVLMGRANKIYKKNMKYIGLICALGYIIFPIVACVIIIAFEKFGNIADIFGTMFMGVLPLILYILCIVAGFIMKDEYAYKKGVIDYANKYKIVHNDFETAEEEVFKVVYKNGAESYGQNLEYNNINNFKKQQKVSNKVEAKNNKKKASIKNTEVKVQEKPVLDTDIVNDSQSVENKEKKDCTSKEKVNNILNNIFDNM